MEATEEDTKVEEVCCEVLGEDEEVVSGDDVLGFGEAAARMLGQNISPNLWTSEDII